MQRHITLRKFGSGVGLTIPAQLRSQLGFSPGQYVTIEVVDAGFLVQPVATTRRYALVDLVAQCDAKASVSGEMAAWRKLKPVGKEREDV